MNKYEEIQQKLEQFLEDHNIQLLGMVPYTTEPADIVIEFEDSVQLLFKDGAAL